MNVIEEVVKFLESRVLLSHEASPNDKYDAEILTRHLRRMKAPKDVDTVEVHRDNFEIRSYFDYRLDAQKIECSVPIRSVTCVTPLELGCVKNPASYLEQVEHDCLRKFIRDLAYSQRPAPPETP